MKIEITQNDHGVDVVTINGEAVSGAVATIVLDAAHNIEHRQDVEANQAFVLGRDSVNDYDPCAECNGLGCEAMCAANGDVPSSDDAWGPEDGGMCPCGGTSCDGTCGQNVPF